MLLLDQVERQVLNERQVAAIFNASGNYEPQPLPDVREWRERFDAALVEEPDLTAMSVMDIEQQELREALGVT